mmetsp:Transcript_16002/g.34623  ORF Transcript_16002/g.34623 Transcript_16002/m.34623 type:complete len:262 (-) Transcript_16002:122-907(-)
MQPSPKSQRPCLLRKRLRRELHQSFRPVTCLHHQIPRRRRPHVVRGRLHFIVFQHGAAPYIQLAQQLAVEVHLHLHKPDSSLRTRAVIVLDMFHVIVAHVFARNPAFLLEPRVQILVVPAVRLDPLIVPKYLPKICAPHNHNPVQVHLVLVLRVAPVARIKVHCGRRPVLHLQRMRRHDVWVDFVVTIDPKDLFSCRQRHSNIKRPAQHPFRLFFHPNHFEPFVRNAAQAFLQRWRGTPINDHDFLHAFHCEPRRQRALEC